MMYIDSLCNLAFGFLPSIIRCQMNESLQLAIFLKATGAVDRALGSWMVWEGGSFFCA